MNRIYNKIPDKSHEDNVFYLKKARSKILALKTHFIRFPKPGQEFLGVASLG